PLHDSIYQALKRTCLTISNRDDLKVEREPNPLKGEVTVWVVRDKGTHKRWALHRVTESLTMSRPSSSPVLLNLVGCTPADAATELDHDQIPTALRDALNRSMAVDGISLFNATITPIEASERWRLQYKLGVTVEITAAGVDANLTLKAEDGS